MSEASFTTADVLGRTVTLLRGDAPRAALVLIVLSAAGFAVDTGMIGEEGGAVASIAIPLAAFVAQYFAVRSGLREIGCAPQAGLRLGSFFVLGVVTGIAVLLGFLLLIVPGILLMVRWWIAGPILIGTDAGISEALRESWRETKGHFWPLLGLAAVIFSPPLAVVAYVASSLGSGQMTTVDAAAFNLATNAALVAGWYSSVAAYSYSAGARSGLSQIFS